MQREFFKVFYGLSIGQRDFGESVKTVLVTDVSVRVHTCEMFSAFVGRSYPDRVNLNWKLLENRFCVKNSGIDAIHLILYI